MSDNGEIRNNIYDIKTGKIINDRSGYQQDTSHRLRNWQIEQMNEDERLGLTFPDEYQINREAMHVVDSNPQKIVVGYAAPKTVNDYNPPKSDDKLSLSSLYEGSIVNDNSIFIDTVVQRITNELNSLVQDELENEYKKLQHRSHMTIKNLGLTLTGIAILSGTFALTYSGISGILQVPKGELQRTFLFVGGLSLASSLGITYALLRDPIKKKISKNNNLDNESKYYQYLKENAHYENAFNVIKNYRNASPEILYLDYLEKVFGKDIVPFITKNQSFNAKLENIFTSKIYELEDLINKKIDSEAPSYGSRNYRGR